MYWGWHHAAVYEQLWLVGAQIAFAYLLDIGYAWRRYGRYRLGFAPLPIVGSINLFLWMRDEWFVVQFAMVALAYVAREHVRWKRDEGGPPVHVFNPSAIALSTVALVLIAGGWTELARGREIATTLGIGAHCYTAILVAGLMVQLLFPVVLMTMSALATTVLLGVAYTAATGSHHYIDTAVPVAVFLGMTLLITDPVTSPRDTAGRVVFGALYGAGVFVAFELLNAWTDAPWGPQVSYFDKLLCVPLLNLLVPWIERLTKRAAWTDRNLLHVALYIGLFALVEGQLTDHPGRQVAFWVEACAAERHGACDRLVIVARGRCQGEARSPSCEQAEQRIRALGCDRGIAESCEQVAMMGLTSGGAPEAAVKPLRVACDGGLPNACGTLGMMYATGRGVAPDAEEAKRLLRRGCDGGMTPACRLLRQLASPR